MQPAAAYPLIQACPSASIDPLFCGLARPMPHGCSTSLAWNRRTSPTRNQRATDALTWRVNEIEEARKTEKEELDQLRYFASMEQANVAYVKSYREKYGAHAV